MTLLCALAFSLALLLSLSTFVMHALVPSHAHVTRGEAPFGSLPAMPADDNHSHCAPHCLHNHVMLVSGLGIVLTPPMLIGLRRGEELMHLFPGLPPLTPPPQP